MAKVVNRPVKHIARGIGAAGPKTGMVAPQVKQLQAMALQSKLADKKLVD